MPPIASCSGHWDAIQFLEGLLWGATHFLTELLFGMPSSFLQEAMWCATHVPDEFPWWWWRGEGGTPAPNPRLEGLQRRS